MKSLLVFACLFVVANSIALFRNGQCLNRDPWDVNRVGSTNATVRAGNYYLDKLNVQLENISVRIETLELKHNKEDKAELVRQIGEAQHFETQLKTIKCEFIEEDLKSSSLEEKYKLQYEVILVRIDMASEILSSFIVRMNSIEVLT